MRIRTAALAVAAGLFAAAPFASAMEAGLDPVHSMVVFRIGHANASAPFGVFHGVEGSVVADSPTATPSAVTVTVPVEKLDMGNGDWEKHIKSADFFNAAQFPTIVFKSTSIKPAGGSADTFEAAGELTLHGVTKPVTVTLHRLGVGKGMQGETRVGYSTDFKVSRKDFGITKYEGPVGDEVSLMVNIEGVVK